MVTPVFPAVDFTRLLPPVDTANTDQIRGVVPQAPPHIGVDETFQNQVINRPTGQVLTVNTFGERNIPTLSPAEPVLGDNPNFLRPFGTVLTANTTDPRGTELEVTRSVREDRFDATRLRDTLFIQDAQQALTQSGGLTEPALGSLPQNFLSRPNLLEVSGFEQGDRTDARDRSDNPDRISEPDTRIDSRFFDFLFRQEAIRENRAIAQLDARTISSAVTRERAETDESFVDFEALLNRNDLVSRTGIAPGETVQGALAALPPGTPVDASQQPSPVEFNLEDNLLDREPILAFQRDLVRDGQQPPPRLFDLAPPGPLEPPVPSADEALQADLRRRPLDEANRVSELETGIAQTERFENPVTGLVDGSFPLIGAVANRVA